MHLEETSLQLLKVLTKATRRRIQKSFPPASENASSPQDSRLAVVMNEVATKLQ